MTLMKMAVSSVTTIIKAIISNISELFIIVYETICQIVGFFRGLSTIPTPSIFYLASAIESPIRVLYLKVVNKTDFPEAGFELLRICIANDPSIQEAGVFKIWFGYYPVVCVIRPEQAEVLFRSPHLPKAWFYKYVTITPTGVGIVSANGDIWKSHRKLLAPGFNYKVVEKSVPVINRLVREGCLTTMTNYVREHGDRYVIDNVSPLLESTLFDISFETSTGLSSSGRKDGHPLYQQAMHAFCEYLVVVGELLAYPWARVRPFSWLLPLGWKYKHLIHEVLTPFIDSVYEERREYLEKMAGNNGEIKPETFLDIVINASSSKNPNEATKMSQDDVREEIFEFIGAGFETLTTTLIWALLLLGHHPEVQERMVKEVQTVVGDTEDITFENVRDLKYVEAVAKEVLRLYPPAPGLGRGADADIELPLGGGPSRTSCIIPKWATVFFWLLFIHRSPYHWSNPDAFDPERFLLVTKDDNGQLQRHHPYSWIPFLAGPRKCVGQRFAMTVMVCFLGLFVRRFQLKTIIPMKDIKKTPQGGTYRTVGAIPLQVSLRWQC